MKTDKTITIDGGVATGTTTLAKNLALALEIPRIDSGSLYRAVTYLVNQQKIDPHDAETCTKLARDAKFDMPEGEVLRVNDQTVVEWIDGQRIDKLHTAEVDQWVSEVSGHRAVRDIVNAKQREFAANRGVVADGRDTGTVVFPDADLKLFLVCDDTEAARRRSEADGRMVTVEEVRARNEADRQHEFGALAKAKDAVEIDTTNFEAGEVVELALKLLSTPKDQRAATVAREPKSGKIRKY